MNEGKEKINLIQEEEKAEKKEKVEQMVKDVVEDLVKKNSPELLFDLVEKVIQKCSTYLYPDNLLDRSPIVGGMPYVAAIKKLPSSVKDCWSGWCDYDSVKIKGYDYDNFPTQNEEFMNKKYPFLYITQEEQERIIKELEQYVLLDADDILGPELGALFVYRLRKDSPNKDWNLLAERYYKDKKDKENSEKDC